MDQTVKTSSSKLDLYFLFILAFQYVVIHIMWLVWAVDDIRFIIMLNVTFALAIISYFSSIVFCLSSCMVTVFGYGTYVLFLSLSNESTVHATDYFWIAAVPALCMVVSLYKKYLSGIQDKIQKINEEYDTMVGFDRHTKLFNARMFYTLLERLIKMAIFGQMQLCVMLVKLNYFDEILKIIGPKAMNDLLKSIGTMLDNVIQSKGLLFSMEEKGYFAIILNNNLEEADLLRKKMKESIADISLRNKSDCYSLNIELKTGIAQYNPNITGAMQFKACAEKEMEYDV